MDTNKVPCLKKFNLFSAIFLAGNLHGVMLHSEGVYQHFFCVVCTKVCQFPISVGHLLEIAPDDPQFYV